jgi:hypothetical protein
MGCFWECQGAELVAKFAWKSQRRGRFLDPTPQQAVMADRVVRIGRKKVFSLSAEKVKTKTLIKVVMMVGSVFAMSLKTHKLL